MPLKSIDKTFKMDYDGVTMTVKLSAPPGTPTSHIEEKVLLLERFIQNPNQIELEFDQQTEFTGVTIRADKPKTGDKEFTFGINVTGAPMTDRSTIYNLSQTGARVTIKICEVEKAGRSTKKDVALEESRSEDGSPETTTLSRTELIDLAIRRLASPITEFQPAGEQPTPLSDSEIIAALRSAWADPQTGFIEGYHYSAYGAQGTKKEPRFWLSEIVEISTNVTSKPTLAGQALASRIRELLKIPAPGKRTATGRTRPSVH